MIVPSETRMGHIKVSEEKKKSGAKEHKSHNSTYGKKAKGIQLSFSIEHMSEF